MIKNATSRAPGGLTSESCGASLVSWQDWVSSPGISLSGYGISLPQEVAGDRCIAVPATP